jgi:hypothetical protein
MFNDDELVYVIYMRLPPNYSFLVVGTVGLFIVSLSFIYLAVKKRNRRSESLLG